MLTKKEKALKERHSGKPANPPISGYGLFAATMMKSHDIDHNLGTNRMKIISNLWSQCSPQEKAEYSQKAKQMKEQYKVNYANYLSSLPEEENEYDMKNRLRKRHSNEPEPKKVKTETCETDVKLFSGEPKKPPIFVVDFFGEKYHGKKDYREVWKKLPDDQKAGYNRDLVELKETYLKDYETFLKSLSKDDLVAYSQFKKNRERDTLDVSH